MIRETTRVIHAAVSGDRAMQNVYNVSTHHRIQASPGYRAAAAYCRDRLLADGVEAEVLSYPATPSARFFTTHSFEEWSCAEAWCTLVSPERIELADFKADPISVIQRSQACDHRNAPLDVYLMDKGSDESAYKASELRGKLLFVREDFNAYLWAVKKCGAVGFLSDHEATNENRDRFDLRDVRKYTSFWWRNPGYPEVFGFVLTPRMGDRLASLCRTLRADGKCPQVNCYVDAKLYDGEMEVVSAFLPGETDEEIGLIAHLCHPRACANDNASGVACTMEAMRVLRELTESGRLPKLRRGVRLLLVPEMTGTSAYLARTGARAHKMLAALNLDMVGGRQSKGYGPLTVSGLPHAMPSFVTDLAALVLDELKREMPGLMGEQDSVPMFNSFVAPFSLGSDHYILSDPSIGVPTPMLGQWPDLFYHTSGDVPEVIDPAMLRRSATIAAAYAYALANFSERDIPQLFGRMFTAMTAELDRELDLALNGVTDGNALDDTFEHIAAFYQDACRDVRRFVDSPRVEQLVETERTRLSEAARDMLDRYFELTGAKSRPLKVAPDGDVPVRCMPGPIDHLETEAETSPERLRAYEQYKKEFRPGLAHAGLAETLIPYYADGTRTVADIFRAVYCDCRGGEQKSVRAYLDLLVKLDYLTMK